MNNEFILKEDYDKLDEQFKELTGLSLSCGPDEWEQWYHKQLQIEAKTNKYSAEILRTAEKIIDNGEYSHLFKILENYDSLVREKAGIENIELPYWCVGFCSPAYIEK